MKSDFLEQMLRLTETKRNVHSFLLLIYLVAFRMSHNLPET